ncbi:DUF3310 domain-containing protein [Acidaminococcus sp.]|uniref:DUF3310 domain-containing protein n=1 Tax=Acidaminococcus sp. TaxID=1872103 RepID=UPI003D7D87D9
MEQAYIDEHRSRCVYALGQEGAHKFLRARRYDCRDVECPIYDSVAMPKEVAKPEPVAPEKAEPVKARQEAPCCSSQQKSYSDDVIHHPDHYTWRGRECVEHLREWLGPIGYLAYLEGNVLKYLYRWPKKNGIQDLDKAIEYIRLMKEAAEEEEGENKEENG